ncbi:hypothetical protein FHX42_005301 [Saccharopolyspora lacisalsi]|uniref:Uncharacterized protein n=1 Tax=Halosaccharopolyspora lacisalsi TaxID=1000566 RepID=A0A839E212_9PSEU|nr:hypothetical protein [Halosaccharopolyspora lacisalsi]MBA8827894.1 hypothetical protein [Halosaccharopolyspora lacisalsi]
MSTHTASPADSGAGAHSPTRPANPKPYVMAGVRAFQAALDGRKHATVVTATVGKMIQQRRRGFELRPNTQTPARMHCRVRHVEAIPHLGKVPAVAENKLGIALSDFTDFHATWKDYQRSLRGTPPARGPAAVVVFDAVADSLTGSWTPPSERAALRQQRKPWTPVDPASTLIDPTTPIHPSDIDELPRRLVEHGGPWSGRAELDAVVVLTEHGRCGAAMPNQVRSLVDRSTAQRVHDQLIGRGLILAIPGIGEVFSPAMLSGLRVLADGEPATGH